MIHTRKTQSGEYTVVPLPLIQRLQDLDLWNEDMVNTILGHEGTDTSALIYIAHSSPNLVGSIQKISSIPPAIRAVFKTAWEIEPSALIKMAAARAPFICQSQSMSLFFKEPNISAIVSYTIIDAIHFAHRLHYQSKALFQSWRSGLKTGIYYLRTKAASKPLPMTLPVDLWPTSTTEGGKQDEDVCIACSA